MLMFCAALREQHQIIVAVVFRETPVCTAISAWASRPVEQRLVALEIKRKVILVYHPQHARSPRYILSNLCVIEGKLSPPPSHA